MTEICHHPLRAVVLLTFVSTQAWSADEYIAPKGYLCFRAANIALDGRIDEPAWREAPWTDDFVDIEGNAKPRPRFRTRAKMLWNDDYLFIAADLEEPHVWGRLQQHDSVIFHDNDFELFIDPDGDCHNYGEFEINALGTGWDLRLPKPYKDGGKADDGWEISGLQTAVHVRGSLNDPRDTDHGWTIEIAIPWSIAASLADTSAPIRTARRQGSILEGYELDASSEGARENDSASSSRANVVAAPPRDGDQWRVNFSRVQWQHEVVAGEYQKIGDRREDNWVWSPQWTIDMHRPETWGYVQFSTSAPGDATFRADPAGPAKHILQRIYYAQRTFYSMHQRFAEHLEELNLSVLNDMSFVSPPAIELAGGRFKATLAVRLPGGMIQRWYISNDARVWSEIVER